MLFSKPDGLDNEKLSEKRPLRQDEIERICKHGWGPALTPVPEPTRALRINLIIAKITIWIMLLLGILATAFAGVMMNDLDDE